MTKNIAPRSPWLLPVLLLLLAALPGTSLAEAERHCSKKHCDHSRHGPGGFVEKHADQLDLDAETREAIDAIVVRSGARDEELDASTRAAYGRLHALLEQDAPDVDAVMATAEEIGTLKGESRKNMLGAMLEIRARLTPEQREQLVELREERKERGPGHHRRSDACRDDVEALCPDAESGRERIRCFGDQWDALSEPCRDMLENGRHGRHPRCRGRHP